MNHVLGLMSPRQRRYPEECDSEGDDDADGHDLTAS